MRVLFLEGTEPFVFFWSLSSFPEPQGRKKRHGFRNLFAPANPLASSKPPRLKLGPWAPASAIPGHAKGPLSRKRGPHGREGVQEKSYTANTTEQMLSRMAPNTSVNTIMGHTNLNQWDIFISNICNVAITRPVGAMYNMAYWPN